jgi:hypothetical protein
MTNVVRDRLLIAEAEKAVLRGLVERARNVDDVIDLIRQLWILWDALPVHPQPEYDELVQLGNKPGHPVMPLSELRSFLSGRPINGDAMLTPMP